MLLRLFRRKKLHINVFPQMGLQIPPFKNINFPLLNDRTMLPALRSHTTRKNEKTAQKLCSPKKKKKKNLKIVNSSPKK